MQVYVRLGIRLLYKVGTSFAAIPLSVYSTDTFLGCQKPHGGWTR